jgi:arabinose-5-phosphate isomerase
LLKVEDVMRSGVAVPFASLTTEYNDVLSEITSKKLGFTTVQYPDGRLCGVITDGDLRRTILKFGADVFAKCAQEIMTVKPKTISAHALAKEALKEMERHSVSDLLIVDDNDRVTGLIDLKDLLRAGLI